jgi:hypothetical protein
MVGKREMIQKKCGKSSEAAIRENIATKALLYFTPD